MLQNPAEIPATRGPSTSTERRKRAEIELQETALTATTSTSSGIESTTTSARNAGENGERCADHERRVPQAVRSVAAECVPKVGVLVLLFFNFF